MIHLFVDDPAGHTHKRLTSMRSSSKKPTPNSCLLADLDMKMKLLKIKI